MGRHEADKPRLSTRLGLWIDSKLAPTRFRRPEFPEFDPRSLRPLWSFFFVTCLALVSVTDPYSGTVFSAQAAGFYRLAPEDPTQTYGYATTQTISFSRGGYSVVTGKDAAIFVEAADVPDPGTAKAYAFEQLKANGFGTEQYSCLVKLWTRESQWRVNAYNKSSGTYGIPQALPGSKMSTAGGDWMTNPEPQIRWGINYIDARYGTPCGALAHSDKLGWY